MALPLPFPLRLQPGSPRGISAADRARTIQAAVAPEARPEDLVQPGHIFPLMAQAGGVLTRAGHTEAGCDLAALAGRSPAAVICEILNEDGSMARLPDLVQFAKAHQLLLGSIANLIEYRSAHESLVEEVTDRVITLQESLGGLWLLPTRPVVSRIWHLCSEALGRTRRLWFVSTNPRAYWTGLTQKPQSQLAYSCSLGSH